MLLYPGANIYRKSPRDYKNGAHTAHGNTFAHTAHGNTFAVQNAGSIQLLHAYLLSAICFASERFDEC